MKEATLPNGRTVQEINSYETRFLYNEIFVQNVYVQNDVAIREGDTIFDVGANIGLFALYAMARFNPARVYCFEPAPNCVAALRANVAEWADKVVVVEAALGAAAGEACFTYYPGYSLMSGLFAERERDLNVLRAGARTQMTQALKRSAVGERMIELAVGDKLEDAVSFDCRVTTISDTIDAFGVHRIDLLKIDVERAENEVITGIREEHWGRIFQLVAEVHDSGAREHEAMRDLLASKGFATTLSVERGLENSAIYALSARRT